MLNHEVSGQPQYTNHLVHEKSPYLLMHAHNPVDWYPWGELAFEKAHQEQKPIFLSVGYSTCHWCHVMERESFSNLAIAELMNRYYVNIKLDREERPDVDRIYMTFVQATAGSGGWPMSVFLTPDLKPFFGGTYFPPDNRYGRPGFETVLVRLQEAWETQRQAILESADQATNFLRGLVNAEAQEHQALSEEVLERTYQRIKASYDSMFGGFGDAPKFPRPVIFNFLLRYYARTGQAEALEMTLHSLCCMARGGMHDQIGGGFHRYSTDAYWKVPHFEKMLYDQAQLAVAYLEAYQISHDPFLADVARDTLQYVLRDMHSSEGGFYSAEDADSLIEPGRPEHGEGAFYVWEAKQIEQELGPDAPLVSFHYGVEPEGNVSTDQDPHGELTGKNILYVRQSEAEVARQLGRPEQEIRSLLAEARRLLMKARSCRPRPALDDKILTAWNGLMISALAKASQALDESNYLTAAEASAGFIRSRLYDSQTGKLKRRFREGEAAIDGFLDDYAYLVQGLLDLYEASFDVQWLSWACALQDKQDQLFWDSQRGGYFITSGSDASVLAQMRDDYDGAEPSANSITALNLLRLAEMTDHQEYRDQAEKLFAAFAGRLESAPESLPQLAAALSFKFSKIKQIIIAGQPKSPDTRTLLRLVAERFIPNKIVLLADGGQGQKELARRLRFLEGIAPKDGQSTAYICENYTCKLPTADPQEVTRLLESDA